MSSKEAFYKREQRRKKIEKGLALTVREWIPAKYKSEADAAIKRLCKELRERDDG